MLERLFHLNENRTTIRTELLAGVTTFLAMAYIIFVQPAVLNAAGMDFGAVMVATCLASAFATILMGLLANYPIAVAPAMGHNFFFAFTVCVAMKVPWRIALGAVAIAGTLFILTAAIGLRERLIVAIPASLKHAIAVGIGLLVALIGLQWGGLVADSPGTLVTLGKLSSPPALLTLFGLLVIGILSLLFYPLVRMIGGGYPAGGSLVLYPIVAPALILVGALMMTGVREIPWTDLTEAIPAFLTMVMMPLTVSITEGIAFGFIAYAILKLCTGRGREAHPLVYVCAALFVARYVWL